jgi:hypothetical protein
MRVASHIEADRPRGQLVASKSRQRAFALGLSLALTQPWQPQAAHAEPELTLQWSTPSADASCPDAAWASARISVQLGRTPASDVAHGVSAIVQIASTPRGFTLSLQTTFQGQTGTRTLEGARCAELSEAAILIISLSVSEASEQIAAPAPIPQASASARADPAAQQERAPSSPPLEGFVRADALLQVGLWSRVALGPGLSLGLTRGMFRGEIGGVWFPPLTTQHEGRDIEATLGAARVLGCLLFGRGRVQGGGCAGVEFGGVRTHTEPSGKDANTWWSAATLGGRLHVRLIARLSLVASAELLVGLTRLRFSSEDAEAGAPNTLYTAEPVQLRASLGPELRF